MPWKAQICPFCHKKYANKTGLHNHLYWYTGSWRIPADGVHDVLKIEQILYPQDEEEKADRRYQYKCPSCSVVINSRWRFIEHVRYRKHYGIYEGLQKDEGGNGGEKDAPQSKRRRRNGGWSKWPWPFAFSEEAVRVPRWKGVFPFLRLPFDLRRMIYERVLCFSTIIFQKETNSHDSEAHRHGVWLQHNPRNNPLALLIVNRQVYEEARRVFYSLNSFVFDTVENLPLFLINIGRDNVLLLQSLQWKNDANDQYEQLDTIRKFFIPAAQNDDIPLTEETETEIETETETETNIWNDENSYINLMNLLITKPLSSSPGRKHRLLRLDTDDASSRDYRQRYTLHIVFGKTQDDDSPATGRVSFDLRTRSRSDEGIICPLRPGECTGDKRHSACWLVPSNKRV